MNKTQVGLDIANTVVDMPNQLKKLGNVTPIEFLQASGYFQCPTLVTESMILKVVNCKPMQIDVWLEYSAKQRIDEGWYIVKTGENSARVGYYSGKSGSDTRIKRFKSLSCAIACYIKNEIESVRELAK